MSDSCTARQLYITPCDDLGVEKYFCMDYVLGGAAGEVKLSDLEKVLLRHQDLQCATRAGV